MCKALADYLYADLHLIFDMEENRLSSGLSPVEGGGLVTPQHGELVTPIEGFL